MKTEAGVRCDGCGRIEDRAPLEKDKRPPIGARSRFYDTTAPPTINLMTGLPDGKFRGLASETDSKKPVALHICPGCAPKVLNAMKHLDPSLLPTGPLKQFSDSTRKGKHLLRAMRDGEDKAIDVFLARHKQRQILMEKLALRGPSDE